MRLGVKIFYDLKTIFTWDTYAQGSKSEPLFLGTIYFTVVHILYGTYFDNDIVYENDIAYDNDIAYGTYFDNDIVVRLLIV